MIKERSGVCLFAVCGSPCPRRRDFGASEQRRNTLRLPLPARLGASPKILWIGIGLDEHTERRGGDILVYPDALEGRCLP